jgi:PiT family inorganic phosphate transporter
MGLPPIPLVPVSSSQAIVGAVIGVGLLKGGRGIRWRTLGGISSSWVVTPVIAAILSFIALFFLQNVFEQKVYRNVKYALTPEAVARIQNAQIPIKGLEPFFGKEFANARRFRKLLEKQKLLTDQDRNFMMDSAEIDNLEITALKIDSLNIQLITEKSILSLRELEGRVFKHRWQLEDALAKKSAYWRHKKNDRNYNLNLTERINYICNIFRSERD